MKRNWTQSMQVQSILRKGGLFQTNGFKRSVCWLLAGSVALFTFAPLAYAAKPAKSAAPARPEKLVEILLPAGAEVVTADDIGFGGFTDHGLSVLKIQRDNLRQNFAATTHRYMNSDNIARHLYYGQMQKLHIYLGGPPGSGKTGIVEFAIPRLWVKQVHELMTEMGLIGGLTEEGHRLGREEINTKNTIVDAPNALIDEGDKASPALLAMLLRILAEGKIEINGTSVKLPARLIVFSSNASQAQMIEHFIMKGQPTTGPAFLNRFIFKIMTFSWLNEAAQTKIDEDNMKRSQIQALIDSGHTELQTLLDRQKPMDVDFEPLAAIAGSMFTFSAEFNRASLTLINHVREMTHEAIQRSELDAESKQNATKYVASVEFSERLRQKMRQVVLASVMTEFLLSDLSNDKVLSALKGKARSGRGINGRFIIGAKSLWRTHSLLTPVLQGKVVYDDKEFQVTPAVAEDGTDLLALALTSPKDQAEKTSLLQAVEEYKRFNIALTTVMKELKAAAEQVGGLGPGGVGQQEAEFEIQLAKAKLAAVADPAAATVRCSDL